MRSAECGSRNVESEIIPHFINRVRGDDGCRDSADGCGSTRCADGHGSVVRWADRLAGARADDAHHASGDAHASLLHGLIDCRSDLLAPGFKVQASSHETRCACGCRKRR
jgi:hypothetical protein